MACRRQDLRKSICCLLQSLEHVSGHPKLEASGLEGGCRVQGHVAQETRMPLKTPWCQMSEDRHHEWQNAARWQGTVLLGILVCKVFQRMAALHEHSGKAALSPMRAAWRLRIVRKRRSG